MEELKEAQSRPVENHDRAPIVLVVDDLKENVLLIQAMIHPLGYEVRKAQSGEEALECLAKEKPDLVVLDVVMPGLNGIEVCRRMKNDPETRHIPVVMVTGTSEEEANVQALEAGADDFLVKPLNAALLQARVRNALNSKHLYDQVVNYKNKVEQYNLTLEQRIRERTAQIERTQQVTAFSLARLSESRDTETGVHLERMRRYVRLLASEMSHWSTHRDLIDETFIHQLYFSSPLHDIGKVGIPDLILLKPGKLTPEEYEIMKWHSIIGGDTLKEADVEAGTNSFLAMGRDIAYYHHEKWDGSGYPYGLAGQDIPLAARIVALGDVYDALTSKRPYKDAFPHEKARAIILESDGAHFDPDVVQAFIACESQFLSIQQEYTDADDGIPKLHQLMQQFEDMCGLRSQPEAAP